VKRPRIEKPTNAKPNNAADRRSINILSRPGKRGLILVFQDIRRAGNSHTLRPISQAELYAAGESPHPFRAGNDWVAYALDRWSAASRCRFGLRSRVPHPNQQSPFFLGFLRSKIQSGIEMPHSIDPNGTCGGRLSVCNAIVNRSKREV
jgi:hypothetical protein